VGPSIGTDCDTPRHGALGHATVREPTSTGHASNRSSWTLSRGPRSGCRSLVTGCHRHVAGFSGGSREATSVNLRLIAASAGALVTVGGGGLGVGLAVSHHGTDGGAKTATRSSPSASATVSQTEGTATSSATTLSTSAPTASPTSVPVVHTPAPTRAVVSLKSSPVPTPTPDPNPPYYSWTCSGSFTQSSQWSCTEMYNTYQPATPASALGDPAQPAHWTSTPVHNATSLDPSQWSCGGGTCQFQPKPDTTSTWVCGWHFWGGTGGGTYWGCALRVEQSAGYPTTTPSVAMAHTSYWKQYTASGTPWYNCNPDGTLSPGGGAPGAGYCATWLYIGPTNTQPPNHFGNP
jgi:hypothetical protein